MVDSCSLGKVNVHAEQSSAIRFYRSEIDELKYFLKNKSLINSSVEPNKYDGKLNDSSYAKIGNVDLISDELKYNKLYFNIIPGLSPYRNEHKLDSIMQTIMYSGRESITGKSALPIPINFEGFVRGSEVISYKGGQLFEQTVDYWNFRYHKGMLSAVTIFFNANSDSVFELLNNNLMNILPDSSLANGKPDDAHESENIYGWVYKTDEEQHQYIQLRVINNKIELSFQIFGTNEFHFRPDSFFYTQYKFDRVIELISKRVLLNSDKDFVNRWEVENYDK